MIQKWIQTDAEAWPPLLLRITLGIVIFPHGAQKLFGWFGGFGFTGAMNYFTETKGFPYLIGLLVIAAESIGALALMLGIAGRFMAASIGLVMVGAIFFSSLPFGFFMNWFGNQQREGYEYFLLALGMAIALVITGSGKWSVDSWWQRSVSTAE
jgi:putative oxidoreductase